MNDHQRALAAAADAVSASADILAGFSMSDAEVCIKAYEAARRTVSGQEAEPIGYVTQADADRLHTYKGTIWPSMNEAAIIPVYLAAPSPATEVPSDETLQAFALKFLGDEYDDDLDGLRNFAQSILEAPKEKP
ncbi:MAG: hypothetical protein WCD76_17695 [Pyrinomonadaceae bacterium]